MIEPPLKVLSAIIILFSEDPELHIKMKEAALEKIKLERFDKYSFLCQETVRAISRMKRKK